jgi:hypothetical protein
MTYSQFKSKYLGKFVEVGGSPNAQNQCVDLANAYMKEVDGQPIILGTNACDFPSKASGYTFVENTPSGVPKQGDIMIWKSTSSLPYGHISVFESGTTSSFKSLDQNWPLGSAVKIVTHTYNGLKGWLQLKDMNTIQVDKETFENLVTKATKYDEIVKAGIAQAQDVVDLKRLVKEANDSASTARDEATDARNQIKEVAAKLNSPQDMPRILSAIEEMIKTTDQMTANAKKDSEKIKEYEVDTVELKAEIARLQLLLKSNKSLETATLVELLQEFVKRVTSIVKK